VDRQEAAGPANQRAMAKKLLDLPWGEVNDGAQHLPFHRSVFRDWGGVRGAALVG